MSRGLVSLLGVIGVVGAVGIVAAVRDGGDTATRTTQVASAPLNRPRQAPPGPAPAGKVWSPEHGHWHDQMPSANTAANPIQIQQSAALPNRLSATATTNTPQPPGAVPAGKVWSPEHGHWHDAPK